MSILSKNKWLIFVIAITVLTAIFYISLPLLDNKKNESASVNIDTNLTPKEQKAVLEKLATLQNNNEPKKLMATSLPIPAQKIEKMLAEPKKIDELSEELLVKKVKLDKKWAAIEDELKKNGVSLDLQHKPNEELEKQSQNIEARLNSIETYLSKQTDN